MYPQGVCRIRKPAYAGNGCAIFLVFQTEEVGQKGGCGSQTQLRGVALNAQIFQPVQALHWLIFSAALDKESALW